MESATCWSVCYGHCCSLWHDPCAGHGGERLAAMLTFGSCINFVLPVDVSSLAKIFADAVARWMTLAAVEKVGRVPCHISGLL